MRTAHTLHLNLKVCVARSGRVCGVATHAVSEDSGYGLLSVRQVGRFGGVAQRQDKRQTTCVQMTGDHAADVAAGTGDG